MADTAGTKADAQDREAQVTPLQRPVRSENSTWTRTFPWRQNNISLLRTQTTSKKEMRRRRREILNCVFTQKRLNFQPKAYVRKVDKWKDGHSLGKNRNATCFGKLHSIKVEKGTLSFRLRMSLVTLQRIRKEAVKYQDSREVYKADKLKTRSMLLYLFWVN